jgi:hypothetical protein
MRYRERLWQYAVRWTRRNGKLKVILMHRVILNAPRSLEIDHVNGNGLDDQRANIRLVSHAQNHQNRVSAQGATSNYRGVYWSSVEQRWIAQVRLNGRRAFRRRFRDERTAALAVSAARRELMTHSVEL